MAETESWSTWPPAPRIDARFAAARRIRFGHRRPRVLVAHPNHHIRWWVSAALRLDDHDVACARNAADLVTRLASWMVEGRPADLLICGPRLGSVGGRELIEALRGSDWVVPVLGVVGPHDGLDAMELGEANGVFSWPFDSDDLRTAALNLVPAARVEGAA